MKIPIDGLFNVPLDILEGGMGIVTKVELEPGGAFFFSAYVSGKAFTLRGEGTVELLVSDVPDIDTKVIRGVVGCAACCKFDATSEEHIVAVRISEDALISDMTIIKFLNKEEIDTRCVLPGPQSVAPSGNWKPEGCHLEE